MKLRYDWVISSAVLILMLSGCGGKTEGPGDEIKYPQGPNVGDVISRGKMGATFVGACQPLTLLGRKVYARSRFTFATTTSASAVPPYSEQMEIYNNGKCTQPLLTTMASGDYGLSGNGQITSVSLRNYMAIPHDPSFTQLMNSNSYCGMANWSVGVGKELNREGGCWEGLKSYTYRIDLQDEQGKEVTIHTCAASAHASNTNAPSNMPNEPSPDDPTTNDPTDVEPTEPDEDGGGSETVTMIAAVHPTMHFAVPSADCASIKARKSL